MVILVKKYQKSPKSEYFRDPPVSGTGAPRGASKAVTVESPFFCPELENY